MDKNSEQRKWLNEALAPFVESTYLHQVVEKDASGNLTHYPDLPQALENLNKPEARQRRTHFHVPVFLASYGDLQSTQEDIVEVLEYLKTEKITAHLEVDTYTWEVLPRDIQLEIEDSIVRELQWVQRTFENEASAISAEEVEKVRSEIKDKKGFYSPDELLEQHPMED